MVATNAAADQVCADATVHEVQPGTTEQPVRSAAAVDSVITAAAEDDIVAAATADHLRGRGANQLIGGTGTRDRADGRVRRRGPPELFCAALQGRKGYDDHDAPRQATHASPIPRRFSEPQIVSDVSRAVG